MKQRGVTLIELMIVIAMVLIVGAIAATGFAGISSSSNLSVGVNGVMETRCIEGYKFIITQDNTRQILDEFGKGVKCENPNFGKPGAFGRM
jgi:prepilin-type N-terminal cleavage/methylation domain-containing protein